MIQLENGKYIIGFDDGYQLGKTANFVFDNGVHILGSTDFHWMHYKKLLKSAGLPDIRWHDLRSTYCALLLKSDFDPKAVSKLMGHAKELITVDVYGDNQNIIPEEIPELISYMEDVMPKKKDKYIQRGQILDAGIEVDEYMPKKTRLNT